MNARRVRAAAIALLVADLLAVSTAFAIHTATGHHPAPAGDTVVDSQCLGHHLVQGLNVHDPAGRLLAYDTEVTC